MWYAYSFVLNLYTIWKALRMSPRHRNVKINLGGWSWQCGRPIWTSFHLAARGAPLAGSIYQRFEIYWCLGASVSLSPAFLRGAYLLHVLSHTLSAPLRVCITCWPRWGGTTKVWNKLAMPEANGMLTSSRKCLRHGEGFWGFYIKFVVISLWKKKISKSYTDKMFVFLLLLVIYGNNLIAPCLCVVLFLCPFYCLILSP